MSDTPPPSHPDAEAALISSCLTSTRALQHAAATITPDDLYVIRWATDQALAARQDA